MRKAKFFLLLLLTVAILLPAQENKPAKIGNPEKDQYKARKFTINTAYVFKDTAQLISRTDRDCLPYISTDQEASIILTGSELEDWGKYDYSDGDKLFINKGSKDGLQEGDILMVIGKGKSVHSPVTGKNLGIFFQRKALATIDCIYEDKAIVSITRACHPVNINDLVVPYVKQEIVEGMILDYRYCRVPANAVLGNVVLTPVYTDITQDLAGKYAYITIDLDMSQVSEGDWVMIYKSIKPYLPDVIIGAGIVIDTRSKSSTVKIMHSSMPVIAKYKVALLPKSKEQQVVAEANKNNGLEENEDIPLISTLKSEQGTEAQEISVLFDINNTQIKEEYKAALGKISEFIADKAEYVVILRGYSCSIGGFEYNLKLSKERVETIQKYLMDTFSIKKEFFETYYYGEKDAPFDNSSEKQRRKNRMVNIEVRGK